MTRYFVAFALLLSASLIASAVDESPKQATGVIVKIVDGDTFWIEWSTGSPESDQVTSIRPYLINAPEIGSKPPECFGAEAALYCWNLLLGRYVWITHFNRYTGDRPLAFIYLDGAE